MPLPADASMADLKRQHDVFVGVDSDGCVFDTMELKWKECFIPHLIDCYELQGASKFARQTIEFVNLYSQDRGCNRFIGLIKSLDLLRRRPEVAQRGFASRCNAPAALRAWVERETKLGNPALQKQVAATGDADLARALKWSEAVNCAIARMVRGVPPFPLVRESLRRLREFADAIVCSATPTAALKAEWAEHGIDQFVRAIYGQEAGGKREILTAAAAYEPQRRLMIGDAPGDYKAAQANACLFFPINPGQEEASWRRFFDEGIDRYFRGDFDGEYQQQLLDEFDTYLPKHPPWTVA